MDTKDLTLRKARLHLLFMCESEQIYLGDDLFWDEAEGITWQALIRLHTLWPALDSVTLAMLCADWLEAVGGFSLMSFQDVLPAGTRACRVGDSAIVCCSTVGDCLYLVENSGLLFSETTLRSVVICHQTQLYVKLDRLAWELCEEWKARREAA